ncbi:probable E3 ubiquitin-protein ligase ARI7 [Carica papaya]|uniref:probable E3 ubiquitin-protein ligase ARI7 n=1 Tax=Carica papaya TaxID=3649 RepID=UPI000B8C766E|nr:probable E3 ubiquitin-protein ligase ARI7 [Carica papaya]
MDRREVDCLPEDNYIVDTDQYNDDIYDFADTGDIEEDQSNDRTKFTIFTEINVLQQVKIDIEEVSIVLSIPKSQACILLLNHNWNTDEVYDKWFSNEREVRERVGLRTENLSKVLAFGGVFTCGICFESYNHDKIRSASCGHGFCQDCWASYINTAINNGYGCLNLRCPEPSCNTTVYPSKVLGFATKSKTIKWCPAIDCKLAIGLVMVGDNGIHDVSCECYHKVCWHCGHEAHRPVDCDTMKRWMVKNKSDEGNMKWIQAFTKPCPKCLRPIQKNEGCMHMTCKPPCNFEFCWLCLTPWEIHTECIRRDKIKEREKENLRESLRRYEHYSEDWLNNMKFMRKAQDDLESTKREDIPILCNKQHLPKERLNFLVEAWQQIVEGKRVLSWTYVYGYYLSCNKDEAPKKELFKFLQLQAEHIVEKLHECVKKEITTFLNDCKKKSTRSSKNFDQFSEKLVNLTIVTKTYFENLITALENGLSDVIIPPRRAAKKRRLK